MKKANLVFGILIAVLLLQVFSLFYIAFPTQPRQPGNFLAWLFSYEFGLIKRGFLGEIITAYLYPAPEKISLMNLFWIIRVVSVLTFVFAMLIAFLSLWQQTKNLVSGTDKISLLLVIAIFLGTPIGIPYYVSNGFYTEVVLFFFLFLFYGYLKAFPDSKGRFFVLGLLSLASCLTHEISLLSTIPTMLLIYYLGFGKIESLWKVKIQLVAIYGACIALMAIASSQSSGAKQRLFGYVATRVGEGFFLVDHPFLVLCRSFVDNLVHTYNCYFKGEQIQVGGVRVIWSLLVILPALTFLIRQFYLRTNRKVFQLCMLIGLLPLGLYILGDDTYRWNIFIIVNFCLFNLLTVASPAQAAQKQHPLHLCVGVVAIAVALIIPYPYFASAPGYPSFADISFWIK